MKNNIRVERAVLRISQQDLANAIGVSRQTIFAIENGKFIPSTELALKLSAYFGKSPAGLICSGIATLILCADRRVCLHLS